LIQSKTDAGGANPQAAQNKPKDIAASEPNLWDISNIHVKDGEILHRIGLYEKLPPDSVDMVGCFKGDFFSNERSIKWRRCQLRHWVLRTDSVWFRLRNC
jgi:hypothetical protein